MKKKRKPFASNNFLEVLRDIGGGIVDGAVNDLVKGGFRSAANQISGRQPTGEMKANQVLDLKKIGQETEGQEKVQKHFVQEFTDLQKQERLIYTRAQQEEKLQIAALLEELKKLAETTRELAKEVKVAAQQAPVEPGSYHVSFLVKLRQTIILFRQRIDQSRTWLSLFNQKSKKKSYYWRQFKKSGSKFLLSPDRYMATQAG